MKKRNTNAADIKAARHRSTNLELLGGVPLEILKNIRETAARADLPPGRVFRDVLAVGVSLISDPEQSPYSGLIEFRKSLETKQAELSHVITAPNQGSLASSTGSGSSGGGLGEQSLAETHDGEALGEMAPALEGGVAPGSGDALERSGLGAADTPADAFFPRVEEGEKISP